MVIEQSQHSISEKERNFQMEQGIKGISLGNADIWNSVAVHFSYKNRPLTSSVVKDVIRTLDEDREFLHAQGIVYIILAKEADWDRYGFLDGARILEKVLAEREIVVYKVKPG